jgi:hypothetical protein
VFKITSRLRGTMQITVRSQLTAGIAMVGAAAIAIAPIQPSLPHVQVPSLYSASVELAAFANPIDAWLQVLGAAAANVGALGQTVLADPAPVLQQLLINQFANAAVLGDASQQAVTALAAL